MWRVERPQPDPSGTNTSNNVFPDPRVDDRPPLYKPIDVEPVKQGASR